MKAVEGESHSAVSCTIIVIYGCTDFNSLGPIKNSLKKQKPCTKVKCLVVTPPYRFPQAAIGLKQFMEDGYIPEVNADTSARELCRESCSLTMCLECKDPVTSALGYRY